jgi:hypothetical protein
MLNDVFQHIRTSSGVGLNCESKPMCPVILANLLHNDIPKRCTLHISLQEVHETLQRVQKHRLTQRLAELEDSLKSRTTKPE